MRAVYSIARYFLSIVFLISGFVKGAEFNETITVIENYISVFGVHPCPAHTIILSILVIFIELLIGSSLLFGFCLNLIRYATLLSSTFFLVLTSYIAFNDVLEDCGCFGSIIIISPWKSVFKNIFLVILSVFIIVYTKKLNISDNKNNKNKSAILILVWICLFCAHSILTPSLIDSSIFKIGDNVSEIKEHSIIFHIDEFSNIKYPLEYKGLSDNLIFDKNPIIAVFSKKPIYIEDYQYRKYYNSFQYDKNSKIIFVTTHQPSNMDLDVPVYGVDESLFNNIFSSNTGVLRIQSGSITGKIDLNEVSQIFLKKFKINYNYLMSKWLVFIRLLIWILSFIQILYVSVIKKNLREPLKDKSWMKNLIRFKVHKISKNPEICR